jgi:transcriptional regulator with XRE-family HTH domain
MRSEESERLLSLLDESIRTSRRSRREIERTLGVGQGYLSSLFKGRIQLKVSHVYALAQVLGLEPLSLFLEAAPPKNPERLLHQLGLDPEGKTPLAGTLPMIGDLAPGREGFEKFIREMVRDEMKRISKEPEEPEPDR